MGSGTLLGRFLRVFLPTFIFMNIYQKLVGYYILNNFGIYFISTLSLENSNYGIRDFQSDCFVKTAEGLRYF